MEGRVLIVEDQVDHRQVIAARLQAEGLAVAEASTGRDGLESAVRLIPQAVVVSTSLPDMSGLDVTRRLRAINRTQHVFVMLIGHQDNRDERLAGLEAGANDFVTSPIDVDLVMLRVRNAIQRANQANQTDPVTGMPAGRSVQEQLMRLIRDPDGTWALMHCRVRNLNGVREAHGFMAGDELLRATAEIIAVALGRDDIEADYLGYGGRGDFIVITDRDRTADLAEEIRTQFDRQCATGDDFGERYPPPSLDIHQVTPDEGPFYDIRSLSEALAP